MTALEKAGSWIGVIVFVGTVVTAWANLNNRLDNLDNRIGKVQEAVGSTTCNAILTRQIEAIEKDREAARKALEELSSQYDCVPKRTSGMAASMDLNAESMDAVNVSADTRDFNEQINAVDVLLHNGN